MKKSVVISMVILAALLSPEVFAQSAPTGSGDSWGFGPFIANIKATVLQFVDLTLYGAAAFGLICGVFAISPIMELFNSQAGQPKPWGKAGAAIFGCIMGLGVSYWVYAISSSGTGDGGKAGEAGKIIHERYKGG